MGRVKEGLTFESGDWFKVSYAGDGVGKTSARLTCTDGTPGANEFQDGIYTADEFGAVGPSVDRLRLAGLDHAARLQAGRIGADTVRLSEHFTGDAGGNLVHRKVVERVPGIVSPRASDHSATPSRFGGGRQGAASFGYGIGYPSVLRLHDGSSALRGEQGQ